MRWPKRSSYYPPPTCPRPAKRGGPTNSVNPAPPAPITSSSASWSMPTPRGGKEERALLQLFEAPFPAAQDRHSPRSATGCSGPPSVDIVEQKSSGRTDCAWVVLQADSPVFGSQESPVFSPARSSVYGAGSAGALVGGTLLTCRTTNQVVGKRKENPVRCCANE